MYTKGSMRISRFYQTVLQKNPFQHLERASIGIENNKDLGGGEGGAERRR